MNGKNRNILLHTIGCLLILLFPVVFSPDFNYDLKFLHARPFQRDFLSFVLLILFFYLHYFSLLPRLYFRKKYVWYGLALLGCYLVVSTLPGLLLPWHGGHGWFDGHSMRHYGPFPKDMPGMQHFRPRNRLLFLLPGQHFVQFLIAIGVSLLLKLNNRWKASEKQRVDTELAYLKAQINPHFLFNTLNSIYALAIEKSDDTATAVVKLSGMMRYVISESAQEFVSLQKELAYIKDYIELQQLRLPQSAKLDLQIEGDTSGKKIAPLILIPFIENAFKYGVNPEVEATIHISLLIEKDELRLRVSNRKVRTNISEQDKSGIGLENTRNRLQFVYPGRHMLVITDAAEEFLVLLTIFIQ
jgi:hypothetical protein